MAVEHVCDSTIAELKGRLEVAREKEAHWYREAMARAQELERLRAVITTLGLLVKALGNDGEEGAP